MNPLLDYLPRLPRRKDLRIGYAGAGFIMRDCHPVAYCQAGFNPVAMASRTPAHAQAVAKQHNIPSCYDTIDELLADPTIEVLDLAVPPDVQPAILHVAADAGHVRGILAQ
jgi:predicted dehydrogenase